MTIGYIRRSMKENFEICWLFRLSTWITLSSQRYGWVFIRHITSRGVYAEMEDKLLAYNRATGYVKFPQGGAWRIDILPTSSSVGPLLLLKTFLEWRICKLRPNKISASRPRVTDVCRRLLVSMNCKGICYPIYFGVAEKAFRLPAADCVPAQLGLHSQVGSPNENKKWLFTIPAISTPRMNLSHVITVFPLAPAAVITDAAPTARPVYLGVKALRVLLAERSTRRSVAEQEANVSQSPPAFSVCDMQLCILFFVAAVAVIVDAAALRHPPPNLGVKAFYTVHVK
ncbi:LOW QUALITY PROTEIN: hypothetical protein CVT26_003801 [Gymnopilus dilepis]|uniref:Uncharacterized protein n=1 Tax=Gymnopilus dilepis TaxID=231916 RepID=A0A409W1Q6_9AGAR|nr:LOW QUALITY PROTEIN: hypothetical protein CVT26_003801 [Gymnopilus dilepis]